jgi:hypothetical protein
LMNRGLIGGTTILQQHLQFAHQSLKPGNTFLVF